MATKGGNEAEAASGYVFWCTAASQPECESLNILSAPTAELMQMQRCISSGTVLFLYNTSNFKLFGPFVADGKPAKDIVPGAFGGRLTSQLKATPLSGVVNEVQVQGRMTRGPKTGAEVDALVRQLISGSLAGTNTQQAWGTDELFSGSPAKRPRKADEAQPEAAGEGGETVQDDDQASPSQSFAKLVRFKKPILPKPRPSTRELNQEPQQPPSEPQWPQPQPQQPQPLLQPKPVYGEGRTVSTDKDGVTGYVFMCNNQSQQECEELCLLGAHKKEFDVMRRSIHNGTEIFLFNVEKKTLFGPLAAVRPPGFNLVPMAFEGRFAAQVLVGVPASPLRQVKVDVRIPGGARTLTEVDILRHHLLFRGRPSATRFKDVGDLEDELGMVDAVDGDCWGSKWVSLKRSELQTSAQPGSTGGGPKAGRVQHGATDSGYVFECTGATTQEIEALHVFGAPERDLARMTRAIGADTPIFLLNTDTYKLTGPFSAVGAPGLGLVPGAFSNRLNAQVRVRLANQDNPLLEVDLGARLPGGPKKLARCG